MPTLSIPITALLRLLVSNWEGDERGEGMSSGVT